MARTSRRSLFRLHAWIGVNLGFLLFAICFSGTVAVFSAELSWLVDPSSRVAPPAAGARQTVSWQEMHDRVAAANPHAIVTHLVAPAGPRSPARAAVSYGPGDTRWVLVDPYTGDLLGQRSSFNLVSFLRIFHKQLYIVPTIFGFHGTLVVGAFALALLVSAVTGLISIKRWWRALFTLRIGRSRRLFWSDLHRLSGVWALIVTIVLSLTGIWYLAETVLQDVGALREEVPPARLSAEVLRHAPAGLRPLDLQQAARLAQAAFPELVIGRIALPARPDDALTFSGQAQAWLVRDRANHVQMNPYTGEILDIRRAEELSAFRRWTETADPLHFGTFAGLASRVVWLASGLLLCAGILAGLYGAWLRQRQRHGTTHFHRLAAATAVLPTLALLAASVVGTWAYGGAPLRLAQRPVSALPLLQDRVGPWTLAMVRLDAGRPDRGRFTVSVVFEGARPNFAEAEATVGDGTAPKTLAVKRFVDRLLVQGSCPAATGASACRLSLSLREWNGTAHTVSTSVWPASADAAASPLPLAAGTSVGEELVVAVFILCLLGPLLGWIRLQLL